MFHFLDDTFDCIPISVCLVAKSEVENVVCGFEPRAKIDEKLSVVGVVCFAKFLEKSFS